MGAGNLTVCSRDGRRKMGDEQFDLETEVQHVRGELIAFRDVCLPAFFKPGGIEPVWDDHRPLGKPGVANRPLHRWQEAVDRLADALDGPESPLIRGESEDFLFEKPEPSYAVRDEKIVWRVGVGLYCNREPNAWAFLTHMGLGDDVQGDPIEFLLSRADAARTWLLDLGVDHPNLGDTLCFLLPLLAEGDPDAVKEMLDPETWRTLVLDEAGVTPEARSQRLRLTDVQLPRYLNNALLHVFGTLANDHFSAILDLLGHPHLLGGYTDLFRYYVFAVLFGKVEILRDLRRGA